MFHYTPKYVSIEEYLLKQGNMLRRYAEIQRFGFLGIHRHDATSCATCLSNPQRNTIHLWKDLLGMRPTKGQ